MLNLYAVLRLSETADEQAIEAAIEAAEQQGNVPEPVLQAARHYLLQTDKRASYNRALDKATQNGSAHSNWENALAEHASSTAVATTQPQAKQQLATYQPQNHTAYQAPNANHIQPKMRKRHWLALIVCLLITTTLVTVLWQMAQVQMHQNEQITVLQQMTAERRLPEDWPTWEQLNGETFLNAKEQKNTKLMVYKNATQDLPVMLLPSKQRIDCGQRGNQYCAVTFVFDGSDPKTFEAQIIGSSLVFNEIKKLPVLMHELSQASSIQVGFPKGKDMPTLTFERNSTTAPTDKSKAKVKT